MQLILKRLKYKETESFYFLYENGMEKYYANIKQKEAGLPIKISDNAVFKARSITRNK